MQSSLGKRRPHGPPWLVPTGKPIFHAIEGRHGHHVRVARVGGLRGMWKLGSNGVTVGSPIARLGIGHISKKIDLRNGRANQVVRRWPRLGDRNKPVLSRRARGVRNTTFDMGPYRKCRACRPAAVSVRHLLIFVCLSPAQHYATGGALGGLVGVGLRHQPQACIGANSWGSSLVCSWSLRPGHLRFMLRLGPAAWHIAVPFGGAGDMLGACASRRNGVGMSFCFQMKKQNKIFNEIPPETGD